MQQPRKNSFEVISWVYYYIHDITVELISVWLWQAETYHIETSQVITSEVQMSSRLGKFNEHTHIVKAIIFQA